MQIAENERNLNMNMNVAGGGNYELMQQQQSQQQQAQPAAYDSRNYFQVNALQPNHHEYPRQDPMALQLV